MFPAADWLVGLYSQNCLIAGHIYIPWHTVSADLLGTCPTFLRLASHKMKHNVTVNLGCSDIAWGLFKVFRKYTSSVG